MTGLTAGQLARYRGCDPANSCYQNCLQAAQRRLDDPLAAPDPGELRDARRWAARQSWPASADPRGPQPEQEPAGSWPCGTLRKQR